MNLLIDCGNQRIKWAFSVPDSSHLTYTSAANPEAFESLLFTQLASLKPTIERAWLSSVKPQSSQMVKAVLMSQRIVCEEAVVQTDWDGLILGYDHPEQLGIDRYLALLGSLVDAPCLVVDAGTAMTMDALVKEAVGYRHLGGLIAPGSRLMAQSLLSTEIKHTPTSPIGDMAWGRNTKKCIALGIHSAHVGLINQMAAQNALRVIGCGGDFPALIPWINAAEVVHRPQLVLEGLRRYAQLAHGKCNLS